MMHRLTRRHALGSGLAAMASIAAPAILRAAAPATTTISGPAYGTWWSLTMPAGIDAEALRPALVSILMRIDRRMSPWRVDSEIGRFNRRRSTDWQPVGDETATVAQAALALWEASNGAFDPSVGPLVAKWGFGPISGGMPDGSPCFTLADGALRKEHPDLTLDLCGIAKGHALDEMVRRLREDGHENFIVDLGGEVAARGLHPAGRPWRIAIEDPRAHHDGAAEVLTIGTRAVATSGDKNNGFMINARRYSHVIDPAASEPVVTATASVTVIGDNAMTADGWATALMAAGAGGPDLARHAGLDALFLLRHGDGLRRLAIGGFNDHLA